ncbi:hypothetical protein [Niabella aquatica]
MKKSLKRLKFESLQDEFDILSEEDSANVFAGSGIDGLCYFEALNIISRYYISGGISVSAFMNTYGSTYGYSSFIGASGISGVSGFSDPYNFTQGIFNMSFISVQDMCSATHASGNSPILALQDMGSGVMHAIVITGWDSNIGKYTYEDANGVKTISESEIWQGYTFQVNGIRFNE